LPKTQTVTHWINDALNVKAGNGSDGLLSEAHAVGRHGSGVRLYRRAGVQTELSFPRQVQVFCFLLTTFVAPLRPTSVISVVMLGGRDYLLGWGMYRRYFEDGATEEFAWHKEPRAQCAP